MKKLVQWFKAKFGPFVTERSKLALAFPASLPEELDNMAHILNVLYVEGDADLWTLTKGLDFAKTRAVKVLTTAGFVEVLSYDNKLGSELRLTSEGYLFIERNLLFRRSRTR